MPVPVPLPAPRKLLKRGHAPQWDPEMYGTGEIKADEVGHQSPPKKKRRRQALTCTGDYFHSFVSSTADSPSLFLPITRILIIFGPLDFMMAIC